MPVYNERGSVRDVLEQIERAGYTSIVVIDDGSTDGSAEVLDAWVVGKSVARVIHLPRNEGKSAALRAASESLRTDVERGLLSTGAIVINVDADGQHDLVYLEALIETLETSGADAVIARRDFSYHGWYKRLGNVLLTALGSLFAGRRMYDIESGYRVMRLGPLLHAQEFYRGRRYSECAEQAVVLQRLGYSVDNEFVVHVPVGRTRTRLTDAANHVLRMALAWYRVVCWRDLPRPHRSKLGIGLAAAVLLAFAVFLGIVLSHTIYLGNDSAQSYGHVWFIEHSLRSGDGIPWRMPHLDNGRALTFPYAAIPWLPAALVRPILGDWAVTASMGFGVVLLSLGVSRWLPRTASPVVMAVVLLNWQLWNGILQFQLPTIWALAFAALAAAEFDRSHPRRGTALAAAALVAHPLMGSAGLALTLFAHMEGTRRLAVRRTMWIAVAALVAAPAIWAFLQVPAIEHVGRWGWVTPAQISLQRTSMLWWPWLCQRALTGSWWSGRVYVVAMLVGVALLTRNFMGSNPQNARWASRPRFPDYIAAGHLDDGVRYRVLTMSNQEDGMVQLLQAGATLAQDFFDESVDRRSFGSTEEYRCFLARKGADRVLVQGEWIRRGTTNEVQVLDALVSEGHALLSYQGPAGTREYTLQSAPPDKCFSGAGSNGR